VSASLASKDADAAALGLLVKMSARKRRLVRVIDAIARPIVRVLTKLGYCPASAAMEVRSILLLEYWNLGDIVMESPFVQNLRINYPNARIVLLTSPKAAPLLENQGLVNEVITVRVPWAQHYSRWRKYNPFSPLWIELLRMLRFLHAQHFDLAFTARADIRENCILWLAEIPRRVGYAFGGGGYFLTDTVTPDLEHPHFSVRWMRLLEHLGKPILVQEPSLSISGEEERAAEQYLAEHGIRGQDFLVGIHPGARSVTRQWGEENFVVLAQRLRAQYSVKILWFQDPSQVRPAQHTDDFIPLSLPLRQFMAVLKRCRLFICNDSGPMHISTALGVPVVAVFGPTEPLWFGPLGPDDRIVIQSGFWCRPCFDYCLFDQPYCLRTISVESVLSAARGALNALLPKSTQCAIKERPLSQIKEAGKPEFGSHRVPHSSSGIVTKFGDL
jgi:lipopolysaccharide heptosyltransferase II